MKKNILFLALTLLITAPLAASDYPYPMEGHDRNLELLFPYESDKDADGPYVQGYHTRNPKNIFEETKALFALSETQPTEKALYYLSEDFKKLQDNPGCYMQTQLQRYLHAIDALRKDLHQPENVNRMAQQALANDHVSVRNQLKITTTSKNVILFLHDKKNPFRARGLETIKDIITLLQPSAASEPTTTEIPTINVFEEEENKTHSATSAAKHSAMGTQSPKASSFSKQQKDRRTIPPLSFSSTAETVRYQATPDELTAMHETLDPIKMNMALNQGILVDEPESPLAERMQKGSLAQLNDMPVLPKTK